MANVEFWICRGETRIRLPVNPSSVEISSPYGYNDVSVSQLGEYTIQGFKEMDTFSFSSFFPAEFHPSYCEYRYIPEPRYIIDRLNEWRERTPQIRFILTTPNLSYNTHATIRDLQLNPSPAGSIGDIYYSMTLKEFREVKIREIDTEKKKEKTSERPEKEKEPAPKTYTVQSGDSLWAISKRMLGNGDDWRKLYNANKKTIGSNPNLIQPGMKLVIPS